MNDQVENYPEVNLDPRGEQMKDLPLPPGQITAEVLRIVCLVLVSIVVKTIFFISATTKEPEKYDFSSEKNDCSNITKSQQGLAAAPEKHIAGILGLTCFVLICIIVPVWVISHSYYKEQNNFFLEKNDCPNVTKSEKACQCGPCPKGWMIYSNNCYYFSAEKITWNESVMACQRKKSQLLYIDTEEEMKFMKSISVLSWIGVYRNGNSQPWMFINGSTFQLEIRKPVPDNHHCVMLQFTYYAEKCEDKNMYYCKHKI